MGQRMAIRLMRLDGDDSRARYVEVYLSNACPRMGHIYSGVLSGDFLAIVVFEWRKAAYVQWLEQMR